MRDDCDLSLIVSRSDKEKYKGAAFKADKSMAQWIRDSLAAALYKTEEVKVDNLDQIVGQHFLEAEIPRKGESASGCKQEAVLHFSNGKEILIFVHDDGTLCIEGD